MKQKREINPSMPAGPDSDANRVTARFLRLLSNPTSLMIFNMLRKEEGDIIIISERLKISPKMISDALASMEKERIIVSHVSAQRTWYQAADSKLVNALIRIIDFPERNLKKERIPNKLARIGKNAHC